MRQELAPPSASRMYGVSSRLVCPAAAGKLARRAARLLRSFVKDSRTGRRRQAPRKDNHPCRPLQARTDPSGIHRRRRRDGLSPSCRDCLSIRRARLVAICDADPVLLERRKAEWNVDQATTDAESLCDPTWIDAVVIATPNDTHRPIAVAAARGGKHIMCEKPLGLSAQEVRQMYEAARDAGVVHMTAFTYRFAPSMRYFRHLLKSGAGHAPAFSFPAVS